MSPSALPGIPPYGPSAGALTDRTTTNEETNKTTQEAEQRRIMLVQALTTEARERLARIQMVKPDKVRQLEEICLMHWMKIMRGGGGGKFNKITEDDLLQLLDSMEEQQQQQGQQRDTAQVVVIRHNVLEDDELDLDQFDL